MAWRGLLKASYSSSESESGTKKDVAFSSISRSKAPRGWISVQVDPYGQEPCKKNWQH